MRSPQETTLLLVDDEPELRDAMAYEFESKGFRVIQAGSGTAAFSRVENDPIDIVISDVRMPEGDGMELLDRLKARNPFSPLVILVSGFADISLEEAYDRGAEAVFPKPFDRKQLGMMVQWLMRPLESRWAVRPLRIPVDMPIGLRFQSGTTLQGKVTNFGRGGLFVALSSTMEENPEEDCEFHLTTGMVEAPNISGRARVRWVQKGDQPGCGLEFQFADTSCRRALLHFLNFLKTRAFIPLR